jgi:hypothetical protein
MRPQDFLARFRPRHFFHFTDLRNLPSIRQHGLLAVSELEERQIVVPKPGGNEWSREADRLKCVESFVHLSLTDNHPMEFVARQNGHIGETRYLEIDPSAILQDDVMGCAVVANRGDAVVLPIADALDQMDLEILYGGRVNFANLELRRRYNEAKKAEILIPRRIELRYIRNL